MLVTFRLCIHSSAKLLYLFHVCCAYLYAGVEGFATEEDQEMLNRVEKQLKRRFVIGSQVSEHAIVQDFTRQVCTNANH